ncbi:MAG: CHAT domain-containing protein, partial [Bacteroidota bacterium]
MSQKATSTKPIILLAFANAAQNPLKISEEKVALAKALVEDLRDAELKEEDIKENYETELCELVILSEASIDDIVDAFADHKYQDENRNSRIAIFHYAGHAGDDALLLEATSGGGKSKEAYAKGLISLFKAQSRQGMLKFVFLNGCSSQTITNGFLEVGVPAVIGTTKSIQDSVAKDLATSFYRSLGEGNSIMRSWELAEAKIRTYFDEDLSSSYKPIIFNRNTALPDQFPWQISFGPGADHQGVKGWNLPETSKNPLFNLPLPAKYYQELPENPYTGLNYFREKDAAIFFGRGAEIRKLHNTLMEDNPIILLHGKSGVGKSSLLFAGLIPRVQHYYPIYFRRNQERGLVLSLSDAIDEKFEDLGIGKTIGSEVLAEIKKVKEGVEKVEEVSGEALGGIISAGKSLNVDFVNKLNDSLGELRNESQTYNGFMSTMSLLQKQLSDVVDWERYLSLGQDILRKWSKLEKVVQKPVLIIVDQVEEIFTRPQVDDPKLTDEAELSIFLEACSSYSRIGDFVIKGEMILAFRKEYFSEIRTIFNQTRIPFVDFHLNSLEKDGIL